MMSYAEKYLHHYFAVDRIGGEWFDMDDARVMSDVAPILVTLQAEMAARKTDFVQWRQLKNQVSNGNDLAASTAHTALHQSYKTAQESLTLATAQHDIHKANLKTMIGANDGIENVITLIEVNKSDEFNKTSFDGLLTPTQLAQCNETKTAISGSCRVVGGDSLSVLDPTLAAQLAAANAAYTTTPNLTNLTGTPLALTQAIKDEHMLYLATKRQVKEAEWECLKLKAQLIAALGLNDSITGIITWSRTSTTSTTFSKKLAQENFETEFNSCLTPQQNTISVKFHEGRTYNP